MAGTEQENGTMMFEGKHIAAIMAGVITMAIVAFMVFQFLINSATVEPIEAQPTAEHPQVSAAKAYCEDSPFTIPEGMKYIPVDYSIQENSNYVDECMLVPAE